MSRILISSTEEHTRESAKLILSDFHDLILTDGMEPCLECLKHGKDINVVLLDLSKQGNVSENVAKIKSLSPKCKLIAISSSKLDKAALEAVKAGANGYITKPLNSEQLLSLCK